MPISYPCIVCKKSVKRNQKGLLCVNCHLWCHFKCTSVSEAVFNSETDWICDPCLLSELPFNVCLDESDFERDESITSDGPLLNVNDENDLNPPEHNEVDEKLQSLSSSKSLVISHLNVGSLTKHLDEIKLLLLNSKIDIFTLSETHLVDLIGNNELNIKNYNLARLDRNRSGGGIAMYINENINYRMRYDLMHDDLEYMVAEICLERQKPFLIVTLYRPPNARSEVFNHMQECFETLEDTGYEYILLGDLNCDMLQSPKKWQAERLSDIINDFNCQQIIKNPTRVTELSQTLIDVIITNDCSKIQESGIVQVTISDHYMVYCIRGRQKEKPQKHKFKYFRNWKKVNWDVIKHELNELNWESILQCTDCQISCDNLYHIITGKIDKHAPPKKCRIKNYTSPWITTEILSLIRERDKQKLKAKSSCSKKDWSEYRSLRNKTTSTIRRRKREFIASCINKNNGDRDAMWASLKHLLPNKITHSLINAVKLGDGHYVTNPKEIVNAFNAHFVNVGKNVQNEIPYVEKSALDFLTQSNLENLCQFNEVSIQKVSDLLKNLPKGKGCGPDDISAELIHELLPCIVEPLHHIINLSLKNGDVPEQWKISKVTPIFKKGSREVMDNYRPISLMSVLAKIIEKIVFEQTYKYVTDKNILSENQSGFRPHHSTYSAVLNTSEDVLENVDEGLLTGMVMLDLKKAFDSIVHQILLDKLYFIGIRGTAHKWFKSYLSSRYQYVYMNGVRSDQATVECGIPQGSVLGPLLFSLYINDLGNVVKKSKLALYADDTCIYYSAKNATEIKSALENDLQAISEWLACNKLKLNLAKCEFLLVGTRNRHKKVDKKLTVSLDGAVIKRVNSTKYLGIVIDEYLEWGAHVRHMKSKIAKCLYLLRRIRPYISQNEALILYKTLIQCHLDYCDGVWGNTGKGYIDQLSMLQKRALKIVLMVNRRYPTEQLFHQLKINTVTERLNERMILFMHKILYGTVPEYLTRRFIFQNSHYVTRKSENSICVPRVKTNYGKRRLGYRGAVAWNNLTTDLRSTRLTSTFKKKLKNR